MGVSAVMIGFTCIVLAETRPDISPEVCELILRTGMENTAALLEELELRNKAVYLPSSTRGGRPQALIPLVEDRDIQYVKGKVSGRLIVRYGVDPVDIAIAVTTPGSINVDMMETRPGPTDDEIGGAATFILAGCLDMVDTIKVKISDSNVNVEVSGSRLHYEDVWYYRCVGSPVASIVAAISSEALGKPIRIKEEEYSSKKGRITLEILP